MSDIGNNNGSGPTTVEDSSTNTIRDAMNLNNVLSPAESNADLSPVLTSPVLSQAAPVGAPDTPPAEKPVEVLAATPAASDNSTEIVPEMAAEVDVTPVIKWDNSEVRTSVSKPATLDDTIPPGREFRCMNDEHTECKTGQYTLNLSRKVISDHFGRNKACTRLIKSWPLFCRKHYQRATYNTGKWQVRKVELILRQFDKIDAQFPGTTYNVVLKKSEEQRLNTFSRKIAAGVEPKEAAAVVAPVPNKHFEAPIDVLRELEFGLGSNKSINEVKETVTTIRDMLDKQETAQVPSIEFLPELDANGKPTKGKVIKKARISIRGGGIKKIKKASKAKGST